jgi:transcription elongation GreA/GreB family factor
MFTKTIKYQKHKTRPVGGTGSYRDLYYTSEVQPEKLKENIITDASPLGQALIGRKIGDIVSVKGHNYKILDINNIN